MITLSALVPSARSIAVCGFGLLAFISGLFCADSLLPAASHLNRTLTDKVAFLASHRDAKWIAQFDALPWSTNLPEAASGLADAMANSAALRDHALQRFLRATEGAERFQLLDFVSKAATPELTARAFKLAGDNSDASARSNGYMLLSRLHGNKQASAVILNALFEEQDARALESVILGLSRPPLPEPTLVNKVRARLHALTSHASPRVRGYSIQQLAGWDKGLREFPADVLRLLSDENPEVRTAAIGATSIASLRAEAIKQRLVQILSDPKEKDEVRGVAYMNLPDFDLTAEEHSLVERYASADQNGAPK